MILLFLILGTVVAAISPAIAHTQKVRAVLKSKVARQRFPKALEAALLIVQAGELVKVVEGATLLNVVAALLLLAILLAVRSGTESEAR